jgi:V-type H+-transporting ATPase subunit d
MLFSYGHMIDNVVLIVTGTLHERDVHELLEKCHPLGMFDRYILCFLQFSLNNSYIVVTMIVFLVHPFLQHCITSSCSEHA